MIKYDPNQDIPYGIAQADFPVTFYDRPQYMFANLLRGDVDGMTRAMLSPDTLSPSQIKTVRDLLLKGKKPSPVMKTILDIATNPLVIIGLIAGLRFPMGSTKVLLDIRKGLLPKAAAMGKWMGGLHGALMKLRTIPEAFETVIGITREGERFATKHGTIANNIFVNAGQMSKADGALVAARLDGLQKSTHYMVKALQNEPEWLAFMGAKDVPIAANLQNVMDRRLISVSDKLRNMFKGIWDQLKSSKEFFKNVQASNAKKGLRLGDEIEDYLPRQGTFNRYHQQHIRGVNGTNYRKHLHSVMTDKIAKEEIARTGGLFVDPEYLLIAEERGAIKKGFIDQVYRPITERWSREASQTAKSIWDDVSKLGLDAGSERNEFSNRMISYYTKGPGKHVDFVTRMGNSKTAKETLDAMGRALQTTRLEGPEALQKELFEIGKVVGSPGTYSYNVWDVTQRYINNQASNWAVHSTGLGKKIWDIIETPGIFRGEPHTETYLVENLLPHILRFKSWPQVQRSLSNAVRKDKILNWLKNHPMVAETLGPQKNKVLMDYFSKSGSSASESIGGQVANWFHISTLGLNMSATSANSMQTFITTLNNVGASGIYRGLKGFGNQEGLLKKVGNYINMLTKGIDKRTAFNTAFSEFVDEMGEWSRSTERLMSGDVAASGLPKLFKAKGVWEKVKGIMMFPFSTTEAGNQLLAFYSGRNAHLYQNAAQLATKGVELSAEANKVGGSLALLTQFAGGPLGIPSSIMNMNPMWRQYMHFPMRYLAYLHGSLRMGIDPNKMDWGTIGRALAGSTAAYIAARNLAGIDLSRGLMVGALPLPGYEKAPFYPFPFVPPAAGVIGGIGKAIFTGETAGLGGTLSMLVPGGIAARRMYRTLSPKYADYQNKTSDGQIPLYDDNKSLIGTASPMNLFLKSIGIQSSHITGEQGAAKWLLSQRDRIRKYRRSYTQALYENDRRKADRINEEFQRVYPELGPITLKKSDIRAIENRREITRLGRIARGLPTAYRPLFEQVIAEASLGTVGQDVEAGNITALQNYLQ
jgi:hypothetical protein